MKQIVPFTKRIELNNNIEEVTSISLDHTLKIDNNEEVNGEFELYLEYKENDISVTTESYTAKIPFNISLDSKYVLDKVTITIDDFYYEIDDTDIVLHIDVLLDNLELNEEELKTIIPKHEERVEEIREDESNEPEERDKLEIDDLFKEIKTDVALEIEDEPKHIKPIFETFDPKNETYVTYIVHIVREEDNIESICLKYSVTKEELSYYNEIKDIKLGDKLIVPTYKK